MVGILDRHDLIGRAYIGPVVVEIETAVLIAHNLVPVVVVAPVATQNFKRSLHPLPGFHTVITAVIFLDRTIIVQDPFIHDAICIGNRRTDVGVSVFADFLYAIDKPQPFIAEALHCYQFLMFHTFRHRFALYRATVVIGGVGEFIHREGIGMISIAAIGRPKIGGFA